MINITKPYKDDMIIPFCVTLEADNISIDVYDEYYDLALRYEKEFFEDYFSESALGFIHENISKNLKGYTRYDDAFEYYHVMKIKDKNRIPDTSVKVTDIKDALYVRDDTEFEVDVIKENEQPASLIVVDQSIAAVAAANYFIEEDDNEVELAVETLPNFRGQGYAKAVLCDMAKKVFDMEKIPVYRVSCFNDASIKTALSSGFEFVGKEYYYNCYKENL